MFVHISFLHLISVIAFMFLILKNPKRFSTTDVEKLTFKISKAKHDEQTGWLNGLKCLR